MIGELKFETKNPTLKIFLTELPGSIEVGFRVTNFKALRRRYQGQKLEQLIMVSLIRNDKTCRLHFYTISKAHKLFAHILFNLNQTGKALTIKK